MLETYDTDNGKQYTHTPFNGSMQATDNKVVQQAKYSFTIYVDEALKLSPLNLMVCR